MKDNRLQELFKKYLHDRCSASELEELLDLLTEENEATLDPQLRQLWESKRAQSPEAAPVDWTAMLARIKESNRDIHPEEIPSLPSSHRTPWYGYAAAAILLIALSVGIYTYTNRPTEQVEELVEAIVPIIQQDTLLLADGSRVVLNAGSSLRYPEAFDGRKREVFLEGEAFFDVSPDPDRPFIVHAGELTTEVLGTSFNIDAYSKQSKVEVTVMTGKVQVSEKQSGQKIELLPNEKARYTREDKSFRKIEEVLAEESIVWSTGRLAFDDAPLADIVQQYYRRYGTAIEIEGEHLRHCYLSLVFDEESPEEILTIITTLTNTQLREQDGKLILYGQGCPPIE